MENILKEKLLNAFKLFTDRDQIRIIQKDQVTQENNPEQHETSQSEDEESEVFILNHLVGSSTKT